MVTHEAGDDAASFLQPPAPATAVVAGEDEAERVYLAVEPWTCHTRAVEVFRFCGPKLKLGMGGVLWEGAEAENIRAVVMMLQVPSAEWSAVLEDVELMSSFAAEYRNEKQPKR